MSVLNWDRTNPFLIDVVATAANVDGYGHVSTHNYVQWMIDCAFAHSAALGLPEETCKQMGRGMAAIQFDVKLLGSAYEDDELQVATWIVEPDGRLRLGRQFQIIHKESDRTLAKGKFKFVCTNLNTGKAARMPQIFIDTYVVASEPTASK